MIFKNSFVLLVSAGFGRALGEVLKPPVTVVLETRFLAGRLLSGVEYLGQAPLGSLAGVFFDGFYEPLTGRIASVYDPPAAIFSCASHINHRLSWRS